MEGKVIRVSESWVMYCIVSSLHVEWVRARKHKRENFLFLCDAPGDFALGCFFSKGGGSKVIGSSE